MVECGFKTNIFGGFNKNQVLEYIEGAHNQFDLVTKSLDEEIAKGKKENEVLAARMNELYTETQKLEADIRSLDSEKIGLLEKLSEKDKLISEHKESVSRANFAMQAMQAKCDKYDKVSAQVTDILSTAKKMADTVIAEAKQKADAIVADAHTESAQIKEFSEQLSAKVTGDIVAVTDDIHKIKADIAAMTKQADAKLADLEALLNKAQRQAGGKTQAKPEVKPAAPAVKDFFEPPRRVLDEHTRQSGTTPIVRRKPENRLLTSVKRLLLGFGK